MERRDFFCHSGATALVLASSASFSPLSAQTQNAPGWNKAAFEAKSLWDTAKSLGVPTAPTESKALVLQAPEIAENGNVVRVMAQCSLPGTTQIAFVIEKNPNALAAVFDIAPGTDASVATNIKMAQSSNVYALAKVGDKFFYAVKEVKVTLGGCGG